MITIFTGLNGSGKTYGAVAHCAKRYCHYDKKAGYSVRPEYIIITDIDGFQLDHYRPEEILRTIEVSKIQSKKMQGDDDFRNKSTNICSGCGKEIITKQGKHGPFKTCLGWPDCAVNGKETGGYVSKQDEIDNVNKLINLDVFKKLNQIFPEKQIVIIIDEVQKNFPRKFYDKTIFFAFQKHRHYGLNFIFTTQNIQLLALEIQQLVETEFRAVRASLQPGCFVYNWRVQNEHLKQTVLRKRKQIYNLYSSFQVQAKDRPKNQYAVKLSVYAVLVCIAIYALYVQIDSFRRGDVISPDLAHASGSHAGPAQKSVQDKSKFTKQSVKSLSQENTDISKDYELKTINLASGVSLEWRELPKVLIERGEQYRMVWYDGHLKIDVMDIKDDPQYKVFGSGKHTRIMKQVEVWKNESVADNNSFRLRES